MLLFAGCQTYPMGLSKEQWEALSPEKKTEYTKQQEQITAERRAKAAARRQELEERMQQEQQQARQQVASAYANARFGDVIVVSVERGVWNFGELGTKSVFAHEYQPFSLELVKGENKTVMVYSATRRGAFQLTDFTFSSDGRTLHIGGAGFPNSGWEYGRNYGPLSLMNGILALNVYMKVQYKSLPQR